MSRVDDNSDAQRIKEMNEADLRRKQDEQKRVQEKAVQRSFNTVIRERRQKDQARHETALHEEGQRNAKDEQKRTGKSILQQIRGRNPRREKELSRRAALANATQANLHKRGTNAIDDTHSAEANRTAELLERTSQENEHIRETSKEEEDRDLEAREHRQAEVKSHNRGDGTVDPDGGQNQQNRGRQGGKNDERRTEAAAAATAATGSAPVLPAPLIQRLVSAIYKAATADGRTHLVLELKGGRLDGVQLTVSAEDGRVRCKLSGCDDDLAQGLERAKQSLARGLERRGLHLDELTVTRR